MLQPVFEVLFVNNNIGKLRGTKSYFINGSLKYYGGFLGHPARLSRAMGPTGLEFGSPIGFLNPSWNRRPDVWEAGDVLNYRLERITQPNGRTTGRYEFVTFPYQFTEKKGAWNHLFAGALYEKGLHTNSSGIEGGYFGKVYKMDLVLKVEYGFATHAKSAALGVIWRI